MAISSGKRSAYVPFHRILEEIEHAAGNRLLRLRGSGAGSGVRHAPERTHDRRERGAVAVGKEAVKNLMVACGRVRNGGGKGVGDTRGIRRGRSGRRREAGAACATAGTSLAPAGHVIAGGEDIAHLRDRAGRAGRSVIEDRRIGLRGAGEKIRGFGIRIARGHVDEMRRTAGAEKVRDIKFALAR